MYNKLNLTAVDFASKDDVRPEIAGVLFSKNKTVATDGYSLIEVSAPEISNDEFPMIDGAKIPSKDVIIRAEAVNKAIKNIASVKTDLPILKNAFLSDKEDKVELITTDLEICDRVESAKVVGKYPDYKQIMPIEDKTKLSFDVKQLKKIINYLDKNKIKAIDIEMFDNKFRFSTNVNEQDVKILLMAKTK